MRGLPVSEPCRQSAGYSLLLSNGVEWRIVGADSESGDIVSRWAESMMLRPVRDHSFDSSVRTVSVEVSDILSVELSPEKRHSVCVLPRILQKGDLGDFSYFTNISAAITVDAHETGAILLHAALAEHDGRGVILAAAGGTGKSTASRRLPSWWKSLCDDTTFVARDESGRWRTHPWPTWSTFLDGGGGGQWDVSLSVPLEAIFFLSRSETEAVEPLGKGEGLIRLLKSSAQVSSLATKLIDHPELKRKINAQWFSNLADLAAKVPMYRLCLSLNGEFWKNLDLVMSGGSDIGRCPER